MKSALRVGLFIFALLQASVALRMSAQADAATDVVAGRLVSARFFSIGPAGFVGVPSIYQRDYEAILRRPPDEALKGFEHVFATGNAAAKAYALLGIHKLAPARFKVLYEALPAPGEQVTVLRGCIGRSQSLSLLAKKIDDGFYDPNLLGNSLQR